MHNLGLVLSDLGRHAEAVRAVQEAVDIRRVQASRAPSRFQWFLGQILTAFAGVLFVAARYQEALAAAQEAVTIFRPLAADDLSTRGPDLIWALNVLESLFATVGQLEDAEAAADEAAQIQHLINTHEVDP